MANGRKWATEHNLFTSRRNVDVLSQYERMKQLEVIRSLAKTNRIVFTPLGGDVNIEKAYRWRKCYGMFLTHRMEWTVYVSDHGYRFEITDSALGTLVTYEIDLVDRNEKSVMPKEVDIDYFVKFINEHFVVHFSSWVFEQLRLMPNTNVVSSDDAVTGKSQRRVQQQQPDTFWKGTKDQKERWEEQALQPKVKPPATFEERLERLTKAHDEIEKRTNEIRQLPILTHGAVSSGKPATDDKLRNQLESSMDDGLLSTYANAYSENVSQIEEANRAIVIRTDRDLKQWQAQLTMDAKLLKLTAEHSSKDTAKLKELVYGKPALSKEKVKLLESRLVEAKNQGAEPVGKDSVTHSHPSAHPLEPHTEAALFPNKKVVQHLPLGNPVISSLNEEVTRSIRRTQELLTTTNSHNLLAIEQQHRFDTLSQDYRDLMACCQKAGEHPSDTLIEHIQTGLTLLLQKIEELNDPLIRSQEREAERLIFLIQQR